MSSQAPCRHCWRAGCVAMLLIFCASCPNQRTAITTPPHPRPVSYSLTNDAWMLFLAFYWKLACISTSSVWVYSLIMNVSWIGDCPTCWGCCCCVLVFLCIRGILSISLSIITTSSSLLSSLSQGSHLLGSHRLCNSAQTLIRGSLYSPNFAKRKLRSPTYYPALPSCLPALKLAE